MPRQSTPERVAILETKVDDLRADVQQMHKDNKADHARVIEKLEKLEGWRNHWLGILAVVGPIVAYVMAHIDWSQLLK